MSVDILGTSWDQCKSMVQYSFTSTETVRLVMTDSPARPPRLSHCSWTMCSQSLARTGTNLRRCAKWGNAQLKKRRSTLLIPLAAGRVQCGQAHTDARTRAWAVCTCMYVLQSQSEALFLKTAMTAAWSMTVKAVSVSERLIMTHSKPR